MKEYGQSPTRVKGSYQSFQTTRSPSFSVRDSRASETPTRVKITQCQKSEMRRGERKMRDYRKSSSSFVFLFPPSVAFLSCRSFSRALPTAPLSLRENDNLVPRAHFPRKTRDNLVPRPLPPPLGAALSPQGKKRTYMNKLTLLLTFFDLPLLFYILTFFSVRLEEV